MKKLIIRNVKTALFICVMPSALVAGEAPWISPDQDYVIGVGKTLGVYSGGGSSDEPDYDPPCPPWSLKAGSETWNWSLSGPGNKSGDEDQITVTATGQGEITVKVNRNDTYKDDSSPAQEGEGTPSADSGELSITVATVADQDPNKKWFYFENPSSPVPPDIEQKIFTVDAPPPNGSRYDWSGTGVLFDDVGLNTAGMAVTAHSQNGGQVTSISKWGSEEIGEIVCTVRTPVWVSNGLGPSNWFNDFWSMGWYQHNSFLIKDSEGDLIAEGIGLNEQFSEKDNLNSWNNWGTPNQVNAQTELGGGVDQYGITQRVFGPTLSPLPDENNGQAVYSIRQKYRIGSSTSGDGQLINDHKLTFHRGYATIQ